MRLKSFALRNAREILRDPVNLFFGVGFPTVLLLLMSAIQANIPVSLFEIQRLAPGIAVFGLSFLTLFSATVLAKDRESALLSRLYTTPLTALDFILGYILPMLPMAVAQSGLVYLVAWALGLEMTWNVLWCTLLALPVGLLFAALGLLLGSVLTVKQAGSVCGALVTNLTGWLSGIWFDLDLVGGWFGKIANILPFVHGVELERAVLSGNFGGNLNHLCWGLGYAVGILVLAVALFLRQMKK